MIFCCLYVFCKKKNTRFEIPIEDNLTYSPYPSSFARNNLFSNQLSSQLSSHFSTMNEFPSFSNNIYSNNNQPNNFQLNNLVPNNPQSNNFQLNNLVPNNLPQNGFVPNGHFSPVLATNRNSPNFKGKMLFSPTVKFNKKKMKIILIVNKKKKTLICICNFFL
jgi:hypothetical protein